MTKSNIVIIDRHPGRSAQTIGIARELGTDPDLIHEPSVGVVGTKGDSQCYMGVAAKVDAIHASLERRIGKGTGQLRLRLVAARIHHCDIGRHPQRHARNALFAHRARGYSRRALRTSERHRLGRHHRRRGLRQAAGWHAGRSARAQSTVDHHVGWPDPSRHGPGHRRETGHCQRLSGCRPSRRRPSPPHRLPCLPGLRKLRRHVHLQHHADLHRCRRHAAAAHGGSAIRRSPPRSRSSRTSWSSTLRK